MNAGIFISFASEDQRVANTLCQALESRGFRCWISSRDILPGENFQIAIVRAIRKAKMMLLVFTANSNASEEMSKELALASQQKLMVVPLRVEDVAPNDAFAYEFATRQWIDFFADWETAINQLCVRIGNAMPPEEDEVAPPPPRARAPIEQPPPPPPRAPIEAAPSYEPRTAVEPVLEAAPAAVARAPVVETPPPAPVAAPVAELKAPEPKVAEAKSPEPRVADVKVLEPPKGKATTEVKDPKAEKLEPVQRARAAAVAEQNAPRPKSRVGLYAAIAAAVLVVGGLAFVVPSMMGKKSSGAEASNAAAVKPLAKAAVAAVPPTTAASAAATTNAGAQPATGAPAGTAPTLTAAGTTPPLLDANGNPIADPNAPPTPPKPKPHKPRAVVVHAAPRSDVPY